MTIFLPRSKTDRHHVGRTFKAPALSRLCPVVAYQDWVANAGFTEGPVFRRIDRWGRVGQRPLHRDSITALLRALFRRAGIPEPDRYSSHSLRRGFAAWANANRWDVKALMEYVGWQDVHSALRYLDPPDPFAQRRIEQDLNQTRPSPPVLPDREGEGEGG